MNYKLTSHRVVGTPSKRHTELQVSYKIDHFYAFPYQLLLTPPVLATYYPHSDNKYMHNQLNLVEGFMKWLSFV